MSSMELSISKPPVAIDLFAGAGGLSVGLEAAGYAVGAAVEVDPTAASTYRLNHPDTFLFSADVRGITGPTLLSKLGLQTGELDLLTGCPPCQGFSTLRTRRQGVAVEDIRNELIFQVLRLVRSIRPRAVLIENVPGLADDPRFDSFVDGLVGAGYATQHAILDAQHFGVPQRRRRLVLAAMRGRSLPSDLFASTNEVRTVRSVLEGLPEAGESGDTLHDIPERRSESVMRRIRMTPKDGGSRTDLPADVPGCACHDGRAGYYDVYGRMAWDTVSPTITSGCHNPSKGRFLHPEADRAITLREAALLQTFPPDYQFDLTRGKEHAARQIGNAFPPKLIEPIGRRLIAGAA